ncbi:MAG: histidine kinase [endosymbiont of Galathealinum brachiosum]|uniref:histidine kinase n=1 Tax=endosymbiont of Galathealinum brachiosum TaxID=2200906 RepID=A0A370DAM6_9GAMM|nr:MAG: histidine kinase [endosymbiont of Galathealinum brachiosum]
MIKLPQFYKQKNTHAHNLYRLFMLRNFLIIAAFFLITYAFSNNTTTPVFSISVILSSLLIINLVTGWWLHKNKPVTDKTLIWQLIIDVAAFTGVLYFTGGASNPFGWFYLVPIFIAATLLPGRAIWLITALSMTGYTMLMFFYEPIVDTSSHDMHMQHNSGFHEHIIGMWLGYMVTALLVAYVVARMANSLRERDHHLAQARENALRDERLVALGTLAAGTAHELGTPLSTIAVLVTELHDICDSSQSTEYLAIIRQQVDRCKSALTTLSHSAGEELMGGGQMLPVNQYISDIINQWQQQRPSTKLELKSDLTKINALILSEQTMTQALFNILNNAADASPEKIMLEIKQDGNQVSIKVMDNGSGLDSMIQTHAGKQAYSSKEQGLGLGLFLAHASIERLGGEIFLSNQDQGGAIVKIILPLTERNLEINHDE